MRRTWSVIFFGALGFGVTVALVKGQDSGFRDVLGNTSAPWLVPPFCAGLYARSVVRGALAGVAVTAVAFAGFYIAEAVVLDLGPHPWYVDLRLTAGYLNPYERAGVLSGALYGALGYSWATRHAVVAALALGLGFVAEPAIVYCVSRAHVWGDGGLLAYPTIWVSEIVIGCAALALLFARRRRAPRVVLR
jgi:hypothetical protein